MSMGGEKWVDVDGVETRYFEQGKGETVLLIYGGDMGSAEASTSAAIWERNFAGLARNFHVVAPDKLGQGHTGNPKTDDEYTMHAVIQHMNRLIETLGLYHLGRARSLLFGLCVGVGAHLLFHTFFDTADVRLIPDILDGAWLAGNSIICLGLAAFLARK